MIEHYEALQVKIDAKSGVPVYEQIKRAIKLAILSGRLQEGDQLMTLREMALKLTVNPNTIIKVYDQLENEGFIYARPGTGYFVRLQETRRAGANDRLFREIARDFILNAFGLGLSRERILREIVTLMEGGAPAEKGPRT
jgi:GntR family transcriptional regulator